MMIPFEIEEDSTISEYSVKEKKEVPLSCSSKYYMVFAVCAGLMYGTQNFLFSVALKKQMSHSSFDIRFFMPSLVGYLISSSVYHIKEILKS